MRKFKVKGSEKSPEILTILNETEDKLKVLLEKKNLYGVETREEEIPKDLFESCIRTSYLTELVAV